MMGKYHSEDNSGFWFQARGGTLGTTLAVAPACWRGDIQEKFSG